jgi:hypothetical protein
VKAVRRLLIITAIVTLGGAGVASAAGTATTVLTPNTASAGSGLTLALTGLTGFSGLPSAVAVVLQPGFAASAKSVSVLCTPQQWPSSACPPASQVGTGAVGVSLFGSPLTVPIKLFLGDPMESGDIASVILSGSLDGTNLTIAGRLFVPAQGGLELLLPGFPNEPVDLDSLVLAVQSSQTVTKVVIKRVTKIVTTGHGKHKHKHKVKKKVKKTIKTVYSLITNPSTCSGTWTGTATLTYSSGTDSLPISASCTAK